MINHATTLPLLQNGVHDIIFKFTKGSYQNYLLSLSNVLNYLKVPKYYHNPNILSI